MFAGQCRPVVAVSLHNGISWWPHCTQTSHTAEIRYALNFTSKLPPSVQDTVSPNCVFRLLHMQLSSAGRTLLYQDFAACWIYELGRFYNHSLTEQTVFILFRRGLRLLPRTWKADTKQTELKSQHLFCSFRISLLKPGGYYIYRQFNIQQFCVLPTQCIYVFCVDLRTNGDYFPIQH